MSLRGRRLLWFAALYLASLAAVLVAAQTLRFVIS